MPTAEEDGRQVALIAGEPGSGKSRLVRELAHQAVDRGVLVIHGACEADLRQPYKPFTESLGDLVRASKPAELRADLGSAGGELKRLVPDLELRVGELPAPVAADPDTERHRLHTAVADLLIAAGRRRPLLLVLEDVHWADRSTLLLLRHLVRAVADARLLLLATFRDTEIEVERELAEALVDLRRAEEVIRLRLGGLSDEDVAELVRRLAGAGPVEELSNLAGAIVGLTGGNAFLVCELWRTLIETGALVVADGSLSLTRSIAEVASPEGVREVVSQRLSRLAPATIDLLELAAVAGRELEFDSLRRAASLEEPALLAALEEGERSGMIEQLPIRTLVYRFAHELVRKALYDRLSGPRRAELHLRVAEVLEEMHAHDVRPALPGLAHHFAAAAPLAGGGRAVDYNLRAARAAMTSLAYEEAAERLATALAVGIGDDGARAEAQLELGRANHRSGRTTDALESFRSAAGIARELGDHRLLARAAIGFEDAWWRPGLTEMDAIELLEEAAPALGEDETTLRVMVLSGLSRALARLGFFERAALAHEQALSLARRLGDTRALATVLTRSYWQRGASTTAEVLEMLEEAQRLGSELGDIEISAEAISWRVPAFVALGDLDAAGREFAALLRTAGHAGQPFILHVAEHYGSALALCAGRLAEAEERAQLSRSWSLHLTGRDASGAYGVQMFSVRREQGRLAELMPIVRLLTGPDRGGAWRPGLAALLAELGMEEEARRELERTRARGLEELRGSLWPGSLTYLADACRAVGDAHTAELVYPELEPLAGSAIMVGHLVACYGATDRYLGMLAATLGETERAERHFEDALELNRRMGARTWLAHTGYEYARMLLEAPSASGRERASGLLLEAATLGDEIGMPGLVAKIRALGSPLPSGGGLPDGLSPREADILRLLTDGLSNRSIGERLYISEHTAANHVRSILRKTGCANRTEAASYAFRRGLVVP